MKKVLVVGASGATGKLLVQQLLQQGIKVVAILRTTSTLLQTVDTKTNLHIVRANISCTSSKPFGQVAV